MNLRDLIGQMEELGYSDEDASARVCQDIVLKAISNSRFSRNVTIKGGVVMRSLTGNIRRATQDMDIDFIRYSLLDESIDSFIQEINCLDGVRISRIGKIVELSQQDYHGKRVFVIISDDNGNSIESKIDLGVHKRLEISQEEYCFDITFDDEGASLLINSREQMVTEKLRSLLKFGRFSTRYKDIFDIYYHCDKINIESFLVCMESFVFSDAQMREKNMDELKEKVKLPELDSKLKHIFRNAEGHLPDTTENRKMLKDLANDRQCHLGKDKWGNDWHARLREDGTQDWVEHRNQEIWDGGRNSSPIEWDDETGLKYNPWR